MYRHAARLPLLALTLTLAACGGGDPPAAADGEPASAQSEQLSQTALAVASADRVAATTATAQSETNACAVIRPFYWEIGDGKGRLASGSIASPTTTTRYTAATQMAIASASKWIYGAFVAQRTGGALTDTDRKFLSMRSGYVSMQECAAGQTVDGCLNYEGNGAYTAESDGRFYYNGGHMQKHASLTGLGTMTSAKLTAAVKAQIGPELKIAYAAPELAGGVVTSADAYAQFLRKMINGQLVLGSLLGSDPACTNPRTCAKGEAQLTPAPIGETWHYSIGHWVEDDPVTGDGAFSSGGTFGFYPWIDAKKTSYGIVARKSAPNSGDDSAMCGRLIRKAWATGRAV